ncbi:hypothetical protein P43SY_008828 [Pythium insidiosum]|uniref:Uncharacterized protein n=1 Tax=Pythium insidiosum TaxID=114742 RepID=A0AAD5LFU0_PYTIN|nr:hypothetical protein P43SY_008828 [Pythium insidiosum]
MLMTQKPEALPDQSLWAMSTPAALNGARSHQDASSVLSTATIKTETTSQIFHVTSSPEAAPRSFVTTEVDNQVQLPGGSKRRPKAKAERSEAELQYKRKRHADAERERIHRKRAEILRMRVLVDQLELQLRTLHDSDLVDATLEPPEPSRDPRTSEPASTIYYQDLLSDECFTMMRDLMHESKIFNVHCDDDEDLTMRDEKLK